MLKLFLFVLFLASLVFVPVGAHAQILPACNPIGPLGNPTTCGVQHLFVLLINIFNFLLTLAAVILLLFAVVSGVRMIIFHFGEQPESELMNAKLTLTRAIVGFAIVAGAMVIVNTVLFILGLTFGGAGSVGSQLCNLGICGWLAPP